VYKYQWYGYETDLATGEVPVVWVWNRPCYGRSTSGLGQSPFHGICNETNISPDGHKIIPWYHSTHTLFISLVFIVYCLLSIVYLTLVSQANNQSTGHLVTVSQLWTTTSMPLKCVCTRGSFHGVWLHPRGQRSMGVAVHKTQTKSPCHQCWTIKEAASLGAEGPPYSWKQVLTDHHNHLYNT